MTSHAVAGPVWLVAGASLTFGALVSLQASGLMWVIPAVTTVVGIIAISYGANLGARTAVLYDQHVNAKRMRMLPVGVVRLVAPTLTENRKHPVLI